jgi:hypothetical protein
VAARHIYPLELSERRAGCGNKSKTRGQWQAKSKPAEGLAGAEGGAEGGGERGGGERGADEQLSQQQWSPTAVVVVEGRLQELLPWITGR